MTIPGLKPGGTEHCAGRWLLLVLASCAAFTAACAQSATLSPGSLKELSIEDLMRVQVTSVARTPVSLIETASAIRVISSTDIRRSGATSIAETLRQATNLHVAQKGSHNWSISARGFNTELANKLLVMMDGRTVYTPLFSGVFWDRQDYLLEDLHSIEVVNGPGSTLWGANAVNGVINITSKPAAETQGSYLEAMMGTELRSGFAGRYGGALSDDVHFRVYAKYQDRDEAVTASGALVNDASQFGQVGFRLDARSSELDEFTVQGDIYGGDHGNVTGGESRVSGGNVLARWTRPLTRDDRLSLQVYYDRTHFRVPTPPFVIGGTTLAPEGIFIDDLDTFDVDFQHNFTAANAHRFVWGLGLRTTKDRAVNSPGLALEPAALDQTTYSGFLQDQIELADRVSLTVGSKLEHNDYTGWEVQPSVRLQWLHAPEKLVWGSITRAVRTPSRLDRDLRQPTTLVVLSGSDTFESETLIAYEVGYRGQVGSNAAVSVSLFWNDYDDVRSTSPTPGTFLPFVFTNNLAGETYGVEINGRYHVTDSFRLRLSYNHLKTRLAPLPGTVDINNALNETADPEHHVTLRASLDLPHNLEFDASLRWVDSFTINNNGAAATVPSYTELDLRLGWHLSDQLELSLVGRNLLHDQHFEYGIPGPDQIEIQRSAHAKLAWRF